MTDEVTDLFAAYADGLNDFDADAIVDLFAYPATIWQFGKGHVFAEREDLLENVEALLAAFDNAGVVTSSFNIDTSAAAHGGSAFASVTWAQDDGDGQAVHEFTCDYLLVQTGEGLAIASVVNPDVED